MGNLHLFIPKVCENEFTNWFNNYLISLWIIIMIYCYFCSASQYRISNAWPRSMTCCIQCDSIHEYNLIQDNPPLQHTTRRRHCINWAHAKACSGKSLGMTSNYIIVWVRVKHTCQPEITKHTEICHHPHGPRGIDNVVVNHIVSYQNTLNHNRLPFTGINNSLYDSHNISSLEWKPFTLIRQLPLEWPPH